MKVWITPKVVKEYSETEAVKKRSDTKLKVDIIRAQNYIVTYTHNDFSDMEEIPEAVKTAALILAEAYAYNSVTSAKGIKSETFDEYSYTTENVTVDINSLHLAALLDEYVKIIPDNGVTMRMRKL